MIPNTPDLPPLQPPPPHSLSHFRPGSMTSEFPPRGRSTSEKKIPPPPGIVDFSYQGMIFGGRKLPFPPPPERWYGFFFSRFRGVAKH